MIVIKDAMVLIHLAKMTLLETCCVCFTKTLIAEAVFSEAVIEGKKKEMEDSYLIEKMIREGKIHIKKVHDKEFLRIVHEHNIYGGEAESLALYKQEHADFLITDDDNVRRKKDIFQVRVIGSLGVLLKLREMKRIDQIKFENSVERMRTIGWFSTSVLDKVLMEGENYG